jgi:EpsI family protein
MSFLRDKHALLLTVVLLLQAAVYYAASSRREIIPNVAPLATFPSALGDWHMIAEYPLTDDTQRVLRADDTLNREYLNVSQAKRASLWIAYYKTQRYGQTPHSPKACLPGEGWEPIENTTIPIVVPFHREPIVANKYVVVGSDASKEVVVYWFQSHNRVVASEYAARFWLVLDSMRYHRSDTSLVRVVVRVENDGTDAATRTAMGFVQALFPDLLRQLPI